MSAVQAKTDDGFNIDLQQSKALSFQYDGKQDFNIYGQYGKEYMSRLNELRANGRGHEARVMENNLKKSGFKINTFEDLMALNYPFLLDDQFMAEYEELKKADAPLLSTTTGVYTAVHGYEAYEQIIQEANLFQLLPKGIYDLGGYRAITQAGATSGGGIAENGVVPDTIKPSFQEVTVDIKEFSIAFETSLREQFLSGTNNNVWRYYENSGGDAMSALRAYMSVEAGKLINRQLLGDNNTLAGNNFESIDRIVGSYSEINGVGQDAGDLDIYGVDRDAGASWADSYVNHGSGNDRNLTPAILKDMVTNARKYWKGNGSKQNKVWLTGYDTLARIEQIYESQNTYVSGGAKIQPTINGVRTLDSASQVGMEVATLYGIPILVSNDVPQDVLSRIYLLDLDYLTFNLGIPMQYYEGGASQGTVIEYGKFGSKGAYYMAGELFSTKFRCHAKGRDLQ